MFSVPISKPCHVLLNSSSCFCFFFFGFLSFPFHFLFRAFKGQFPSPILWLLPAVSKFPGWTTTQDTIPE